MDNHELHLLRQQLERCYALKPQTQLGFLSLCLQQLQAAWQNLATFMIHHPPLHSSGSVAQLDYAWKVGLYPYLPSLEEERDWLEKSYRNSRNG